jgi:hypothetical protein
LYGVFNLVHICYVYVLLKGVNKFGVTLVTNYIKVAPAWYPSS